MHRYWSSRFNRAATSSWCRASVTPSIASIVSHSVRYTATTSATDTSARAFVSALSRIRSEYRRNPSALQQSNCIKQATAVPLRSIGGLDGKTVAHYLAVLASLDAVGEEAVLAEAASWILSNIQTLPMNSVAQCLHSLHELHYDDLLHLVQAVSPQLLSSLRGASNAAPPPPAADLSSPSPAVVASTASTTATTAGLVLLADPLLFACLEQAMVTPLAVEFMACCSRSIREFSISEAASLFHSLSSVPSILSSTDGAQLAEELSVAVAASSAKSSTTASGSSSPLSLADSVLLFVASSRGLPSVPAAEETLLTSEVDLATQYSLLTQLLGCYPTCTPSIQQASPVFQMVQRVMRVMDPSTVPQVFVSDLFSAALRANEERFLNAAFRDMGEDLASNPTTWNAEQLRAFVSACDASPTPAMQALSVRAVSLRLRFLADTVRKEHVRAADLASLVTPRTVKEMGSTLGEWCDAAMPAWSLSSANVLLSTISSIPSQGARMLLRRVSKHVVGKVAAATPSQLCATATAFGRTHVRNGELCDAITERTAILRNELTLHQGTMVLSALAAVEYRKNKAFLDLAPMVMDHVGSATANHVANLIVSYAKLVVWNYKLFSALALRALEVKEAFRPPQMIAVLAAFHRMDFSCDDLTQFFLRQLRGCVHTLSLAECVQVASQLSYRSEHWNSEWLEQLSQRLLGHANVMEPAVIGEVLLAFARMSPVMAGTVAQTPLFQTLVSRAVEIAPHCPPLAMTHICQAMALAKHVHEELFAVFAERLLSSAKQEFPAIVVGSILNSFATLGIKNDRLFIEMIPKVRFVGNYGTPRDVANVVMAYANSGLWHYKLFVRLADRAIQTRSECRVRELVDILSSYAKVEMRYEKLFLEFSPRIQALAHLLTPRDIVVILRSYHVVGVAETGLVSTLGDRAVQMADMISSEDARLILEYVGGEDVPVRQALEEAFAAKLKSTGIIDSAAVESPSA